MPIDIDIDIDDMVITNNKFKNKFNGLCELSDLSLHDSGHKVSVGDNGKNTYVSWWWLQGLHRYLNGDSIHTLLVFLQKTVNDYNSFIIMVKQALCKINDERLLILRRENNVIINKITKGLFYLKNEYKNQETVHAELIKLIEFIENNITFNY